MKQAVILDVDFLNSIIDNDTEFRSELFIIFKDGAEKNIAKMQEALINNDPSLWYAASHAFKGSSCSIGAFALAKILGEAQNLLDEDAVKKEAFLVKIKNSYNDLILALNDIEKQILHL